MDAFKRWFCYLLAIALLCALPLPVQAEETAPPDDTEITSYIPPEPDLVPEDASASDTDLAVVSGDGITFRLFNYSTAINKDSNGWRPISSYFTFRNSSQPAGTDASGFDIPSPNCNTDHDQDGFTRNHATVERVLDETGMPVLDLSRNADGSARNDPGLDASVRSLAYLFSDSGDSAVTAYTPKNTVLLKIGSRYLYQSSENAVDYDIAANCFRLRPYPERNSSTADSGEQYGDFLPFTYTGGTVIGTTEADVPYHVASQDTDYWFGMTMEVKFYQAKNGMLDNEEMVFRFSGDDDVWVFVDDVLVLDLGGTHGTADGSINFVTGEIRQYLSWNGANAAEDARKNGSATSFPTTIRACFDAAGRTPQGGWNQDGTTFADYTEHTLKFFYLERGAAVANCMLDFRLPTLPDKSLTITKELTGEDSNVTGFLQDTVSYRFRVMKADPEGSATGELFLAPGTPYDLLEDGVKIHSEVLDSEGFFSLKAGQSAQFTEMLKKGGATNYIVEEVLPTELTGQYSGIEYQISGSGGDAKTEDGPTEAFTAFQSGLLSAEETQLVTFRNKVDTSKLCQLTVTKKLAEGSSFPPETRFPIFVSLGGNPLPVGTIYLVGSENRTVTTPGILELAPDETAILAQGILSGTAYEITELGTGESSYRAAYHGTVTPEGHITCTEEGVSGVFPLGSTVAVTVTNADYDFPLRIPLRKEAPGNESPSTFTFLVEQVQPEGNGWITVQTLPGTSVTLQDHRPVSHDLVIGFSEKANGTYYYRVREAAGTDTFIYDTTFYILEVTAEGGSATVTALLKNGTEVLPPDSPLSFINQKTTALTVTKSVSSHPTEEAFPFTAAIVLNGKPFSIPAGTGYTVTGNLVSFSLRDGERITISGIPVGAVVTVTETRHDGYRTTYLLESLDSQSINGDTVDIFMGQQTETLHFENISDYELPLTGGGGIFSYTAAGLALILMSLLMYIPKLKGL